MTKRQAADISLIALAYEGRSQAPFHRHSGALHLPVGRKWYHLILSLARSDLDRHYRFLRPDLDQWNPSNLQLLCCYLWLSPS